MSKSMTVKKRIYTIWIDIWKRMYVLLLCQIVVDQSTNEHYNRKTIQKGTAHSKMRNIWVDIILLKKCFNGIEIAKM